MDKHETGDGMRELRTRIRRLPRGLGELYEYTSRVSRHDYDDRPQLSASFATRCRDIGSALERVNGESHPPRSHWKIHSQPEYDAPLLAATD
ncbi:hypothetical protein PG989_005843 [Apiospora arundinis]